MSKQPTPNADPIEFDFLVHDEGSVWRLEPLNPYAEEFLTDLDVPGWARFGGSVVLDYRPARTFAAQLADEGWRLTTELPLSPAPVMVRCAACGGPHLEVVLTAGHEIQRLVLHNWHDTRRPLCQQLLDASLTGILDSTADGTDWVAIVAPDLDDLTDMACMESLESLRAAQDGAQ